MIVRIMGSVLVITLVLGGWILLSFGILQRSPTLMIIAACPLVGGALVWLLLLDGASARQIDTFTDCFVQGVRDRRARFWRFATRVNDELWWQLSMLTSKIAWWMMPIHRRLHVERSINHLRDELTRRGTR